MAVIGFLSLTRSANYRARRDVKSLERADRRKVDIATLQKANMQNA
jgi:hypothetical protein